jgi:hypothetical protein
MRKGSRHSPEAHAKPLSALAQRRARQRTAIVAPTRRRAVIDRFRHLFERRWQPTPAMEATTALWRECKALGGHQPSGEYTTMRLVEHVYTELPVCDRCHVPYRVAAFPKGHVVDELQEPLET